MTARARWRLVAPLALATMATQASIVVLAPIIVAIGQDFGASIGAVGQARAILAATAVAGSFAAGAIIDRLGVRPLLLWGAVLTFAGAALTAAAPTLPFFYLAHVPTGLGVAAMLSAGFAGVGAYFDDARDAAWAMGYVVGLQSIAWIAGNPVIGVLTDAVSWRLAYAVPAAVAVLTLVTCMVMLPARGRAGAVTAGRPRGGIVSVLRDRSARRWTVSELVAYAAWTADLTYAGAFYIERYGVSESAVGVLLSVPSAIFLLSTPRVAAVSRRFGRRRVVVVGAAGMAVLFAILFNVTPAVGFTLGVTCFLGAFAALRVTGSSNLGLGQLPERPGGMMAARTASAQLGYAIGAVAGGAVLAFAGFGALGFALLGGMLLSALLVARVRDRGLEAVDAELEADARSGVPELAVPD